jgi:hypothetical protein
MFITFIFLKATSCLLYRQPNDHLLENRGMFQSKMAKFDSFQSAPINVSDPIIVPGYIKGYPIFNISKVFKCQNNLTKIVYVCKLPRLCSSRLLKQTTPMEVQVFQILQNNPHNSLIHMHEVFNLGLIVLITVGLCRSN